MTTYDDPADRPTVDPDDDTEHDIRAYEDAAATIRPPKRREATTARHVHSQTGLEALPWYTVVRDCRAVVWEKFASGWAATGRSGTRPVGEIVLPVKVLHIPDDHDDTAGHQTLRAPA